ncbi:hypothetical protein BC835DRAFT_752726 [Cytidiella melzeri]|nr:hypothetical protein BC835DRAFT_752726 [Cytidiella melzeri]
MNTRRGHNTGLHVLPDELLEEIGEVLYEYETNESSKFLSTWALSRVCRRLRAIILPLVFRELSFEHPETFIASIASFMPGEERAFLAHAVKSIRIGHKAIRARSGRWSAMDGDITLPFDNLIEFQCKKYALEDSVIRVLSRCTRLDTLTTACDKGWPRAVLNSLSKLRTLRVSFVDDDDPSFTLYSGSFSRTNITSYTLITTLGLYEDRLSPHKRDFAEFFHKCRFPNIHVLVVQGIQTNIEELFQFIHEHPTLLEVNVETGVQSIMVRVEAVLKLIDGTGTWSIPTDPSHAGTRLCHLDDDIEDIADLFPPNIVHDVLITCSSFAFTRIHLNPQAPLWTSPVGSLLPRYTCTALTVKHMMEHPYRDDDTMCRVLDALGYIYRENPHIEELRVHVLDTKDRANFLLWMHGVMHQVLHPLGRIRRLAFYWRDTIAKGPIPWGHPEDLCSIRGASEVIPVLDDVRPPFRWLRRSTTLSLRYIESGGYYERLDSSDVEKAREGIRHVLNIPQEDELDEEDLTLLMRAWEVRNQPYATHMVQLLASKCPLLEEFEWFFHTEGQYGQVPLVRGSVLWSWKIRRDEKYPLPQVEGTLRWTGSPRGDPTRFHPLAGQELKRATNPNNRT